MSYMTASEAERLNQPEPKGPQTKTRIALAVAAIALLAGAVGPWATALGIVSIGPTANVELSIVTFGGAALVALAAALGRGLRFTSIGIGILAIVEAVYAIVRIGEAKSEAGEFGALIQPGWGLYLTIIAGLFLIVSTFIVRSRA